MWDDSSYAQRSPGVITVKAFRIQRTEVSWRAYQGCGRAGGCAKLPADADVPADLRLPVVGVTWREARAYCRWRGGDLPTEAQWVAAARGYTVPVRLWPWGRHAIRGCARLLSPGVHGPGRVGGQPCDASRFGVLDLAGNVREWVRPTAGSSSRSARRHPVRGGSFLRSEWRSRVASRSQVAAGARARDVGFRCVGVRESAGRAKGR
jgi:formylglycine-generating enzyme required for sulfatase activity